MGCDTAVAQTIRWVAEEAGNNASIRTYDSLQKVDGFPVSAEQFRSYLLFMRLWLGRDGVKGTGFYLE